MVSSHHSDHGFDDSESEHTGESVCIIYTFGKERILLAIMFPTGPYSALRQRRHRRPPTTFRWLLYRTLASISKCVLLCFQFCST